MEKHQREQGWLTMEKIDTDRITTDELEKSRLHRIVSYTVQDSQLFLRACNRTPARGLRSQKLPSSLKPGPELYNDTSAFFFLAAHFLLLHIAK